MIGRVEMPGGVLILRIVTATDMSTGETEAQVDPPVTGLQTILTAVYAWRDLSYLVEMCTWYFHFLPFILSEDMSSFGRVSDSWFSHSFVPENTDICKLFISWNGERKIS